MCSLRWISRVRQMCGEGKELDCAIKRFPLALLLALVMSATSEGEVEGVCGSFQAEQKVVLSFSVECEEDL